MRVGEADQLVEVGGDQQHRQALAPGAPDVVPDRGLGADVDAAGRVRGDQQDGSPLISRPTMNFCWLPPESARAVVSMPGVRTSYCSTMRSASLAGTAAVDPAAPARDGGRVWWPRMRFSHSGASSSSPWRCRSSGMYADAGLAALAGSASRVMSSSPSTTTPLDGWQHADDGLDQLGLAVALDAGDAEHLAGVDGQVDVAEHRAPGDVDAPRGPRRESSGRSVTVDSSVLGDGSSLPTISSASCRERDLLRLDRGDRGAAPDDGDVVGDREHLVELVGDEDQGVALGLELAQVVEQRVDLLGHQDRGGLVEDDDLGAAVEHLEDLDPLPLADAERLDELVGVEAEAVAASEISWISAARASAPMPCSFSAPSTTFSRTVRLSASRKCWKTMPMPVRDGVGRRGEGDRSRR